MLRKMAREWNVCHKKLNLMLGYGHLKTMILCVENLVTLDQLQDLVAIYWIINNIKYKSMTVTGYDFFKTPNRYTMEVHPTSKTYVYPSHDIRLDEYWIKKWNEEGKYAII
jgi:hypothetical protein